MGLQSQVCMSYPLNYRGGTRFKKMESRISMAEQGYEKRIKYTCSLQWTGLVCRGIHSPRPRMPMVGSESPRKAEDDRDSAEQVQHADGRV